MPNRPPPTLFARRIAPADKPVDHVALDYEARLVRRRRLRSAGGVAFVADLPETVSLTEADALVLEDGRKIGVVAAEESLLEIRGTLLPRLAWHVGNRHTPCQICADHLLIRDDHVLADMLRRLGAAISPVRAPFHPEGGAYGHGRTFGHAHGHAPSGDAREDGQADAHQVADPRTQARAHDEAGRHDHPDAP